MLRLSIILFLTPFMFGCGQNIPHVQQASSEYYSNNEDHFGFVVFDKLKVDSFFKNYQPLYSNNDKLKGGFKEMLMADISFSSNNTKYIKHTNPPKQSDYEHVKSIVQGTTEKNGEQYFQGCVTYLFFFKSLPDDFRNKWVQTRMGDFEFNVTFFNLLRTKCSVFDKLIYGEDGYWDEELRTVFVHDIFNEIIPANAQLIKNCIIEQAAFNDPRLQLDKDNFIFFLDRVIENKWRLLLMDKN